MSKLNAAV